MQLQRSGISYENEDIKIPYTLFCNYNPDFHLIKSNIFIETKGRLLPEDRRKHLAIKEQHPDLDLRFIFMYANRKMPGTRMTHETWATKNGFKYAVERIPQEWLDE